MIRSIDPDFSRLLMTIERAFEEMTSQERERAFTELRSEWCEWCGNTQPLHGFCQCQND